MSNQAFQFKAVPTLMALVPVAIQAVTIFTLLAIAEGQSELEIAGIVLGLIWIGSTVTKLQDKYGELRVQRQQFILLGSWLGRSDAEAEFDRFCEDALMTEGSLEDDDYKVAVTSDGIANAARRLISFVLQLYLLLILFLWWQAV